MLPILSFEPVSQSSRLQICQAETPGHPITELSYFPPGFSTGEIKVVYAVNVWANVDPALYGADEIEEDEFPGNYWLNFSSLNMAYAFALVADGLSSQKPHA